MTRWETVIGLEVHIQLATKSKIFSGASTQYGAGPNVQACLIDVALPGILPVCNLEAVRMAVKFGLAVNAEISHRSIFARKNYFYPDLPKGYQISQYELPVVVGGQIHTQIEDVRQRVGITRAHLEEDAGKSLHEEFHGMTGIDLNRAGTPLLEIVSEPDIRSAAQAADYLRRLHSLVTYLEICDGNMQEGSFRCDANVSVRPMGSEILGTRTELKNINSFRFVEKGINSEVERQVAVLEDGGSIVQETRQYDPSRNLSRPMRSKEDAQDYRYFPDPDLPPLVLDEKFVNEVRKELPELPEPRKKRFMSEYRLTESLAAQLTQSKAMADYFEAACRQAPKNPKMAANWINVELNGHLNRHNLDIEDSRVSADQIGLLISRIEKGVISGRAGKELLECLWENPDSTVDGIIRERGLTQISGSGEIENLVEQAFRENPKELEKLRAGNMRLLGYFVGQVIRLSQGKANPKVVNETIRKKL